MPLSPTETRAKLTELGHLPRRSLGQNFLTDGNIVRKSLELAEVGPGDRVIEIGPGLGTLTTALLEAGAEVWAIEMDPTLHSHIEASLVAAHRGKLHLLKGDAVDHPLAGFVPQPGELFKIVANLPYAIATPWLDGVLTGILPDRMVLMLQQEAAQRYLALPGTKSFGAISIFLQAAYEIKAGHKVGPNCFHPRPDVDSMLLPLRRRAEPVRFSPAAKSLIRSCFQQRRKQIGALLREKAPDGGAAWLEHLRAAGLSAQTRPEAIPVPLWTALAAGPSPA